MTLTWILFDNCNLRGALWEPWRESGGAGTSLEGVAVQAELTREVPTHQMLQREHTTYPGYLRIWVYIRTKQTTSVCTKW